LQKGKNHFRYLKVNKSNHQWNKGDERGTCLPCAILLSQRIRTLKHPKNEEESKPLEKELSAAQHSPEATKKTR